MRRSSAAICFHDAPPSSDRYKPNVPMTNIRCALVFIAIATDVRPVSAGRPPPVISFHVNPWSVDLYIAVPVGPAAAPGPPRAGAPAGMPAAPAAGPPPRGALGSM